MPAEWRQPSDGEVRAMLGLFVRPLRLLTFPLFFGWENVPDRRPLMFVGNHSLFALIDTPLLFAELYLEKGIFLRGLGDSALFRIPGWRELLNRYGLVAGTRPNCRRLLQEGSCVMVFPGGAREAAKRKGEAYRLIWKKRLGFARLALEHDCTIVPVASLGVDDAFEIAFDSADLAATPLRRVYDLLGARRELVVPIPKKIKPGRLYFRFCEPIPMERYRARGQAGAVGDAALELREDTRDAILDGLDFLKEVRENDQGRSLFSRTRARLSGAGSVLRRAVSGLSGRSGQG